jgi:ribosomal protein L37AE/L43A
MIAAAGRFCAWLARIRSSKQVKAAMEEYRRKHPRCEWDGCSNDCHVHHIIPVHVRPDLAANPDNLITLGAARCHLVVGHAGSWGTRYVRNVRELCIQANIERKLPTDEARRYKIRPQVDTTFNAPDNDQNHGRETARKDTDR